MWKPLARIVTSSDVLWVVFLTVALLFRLVPRSNRLRQAPVVADWLGGWWQSIDRSTDVVVRQNLQCLLERPLPPRAMAALARRWFQNVTRGMLVLDLLPAVGLDHMRSFLRLEGLEHLDAALSRGRGVVLLGAHFGLHSYAAVWFLERLGYRPVIVTAEGMARQDASWFYRHAILPVRYRFHRGIRVIMRDGTPRRELVDCLRANEILMIMGDVLDEEMLRPAPPNVLPAPFLGQSIPLNTGPFRLARWQGAPVLPFFMVPRADGYALVIEPPLALHEDRTANGLLADLAAFTARLGRYVSQDPALWFSPRRRDLAHLLRVAGTAVSREQRIVHDVARSEA